MRSIVANTFENFWKEFPIRQILAEYTMVVRLKQSPFSLILRLNLVMRFDDQSCEGIDFQGKRTWSAVARPWRLGMTPHLCCGRRIRNLSRRWHHRKIRMSEKSQSRRASLTIPLDLQIVTEISGLNVTLGSARWVPTIFTVYLNAMALSCM